MFEMSGRPHLGRVFTARGRVRLGDASPGGRLRCDAIARYLQDVSDDDTRDAGVDGMTWVVRRTVMDVHVFPRYLEAFELVTWCAGLGARWAERRTSLIGDGGGRVEAATLWVALDAATRRPARPSAEFLAIFEPSTQARVVSPKLTLDHVSMVATAAPWTPRFVDFDVMGHVNNAVYWAMLEGLLAEHRDLRAPLRLVVEHESPLEHGVEPLLRTERIGEQLRGELCRFEHQPADGATESSAKITRFATLAAGPIAYRSAAPPRSSGPA